MVVRKAENYLNAFFKEKNISKRVISQFDVQTVSEEAQKEIHKIIAEDLKRVNYK